jgi:Spy/CpxP family protein refolding chaperone
MSIHPFRLVALAGAALLLGPVLHAQGQGPGKHVHRINHQGFMGLNLTETQQTQIKALRDQHQAAFKTKGEAALDARKALRNAMMKPETDVATLKALHDKAAAAQFEMLLERRSMHQEMLPLLTPEQRSQLEKRMGEMGQDGHRGRGFGPQGGHRGMNSNDPVVKPS